MRPRAEQSEDQTSTLPLSGDRSPSRWERLRAELASFWDTDLAILGAIVAGVLGLAQVTDLKTTVALTLAVLAALAASLHRDRSLREGLTTCVEELDGRLSRVSRAYSNPLPYDVIEARYRWTFNEDGSTVKVQKRACVRFVHNGVWTILSWHTDIGSVEEASARRRLKKGKTHPLEVFGNLDMGDGKHGKLIGLDRQYSQNQVLDFEYKFNSRGNYPGAQEWIDIAIETFTANLTIEIVWPTDRVPSEVWLNEEGEPELQVKRRKGKPPKTTIRRENLNAGRSIPVRWRWKPADKLP